MADETQQAEVLPAMERFLERLEETVQEHRPEIRARETGRVASVEQGVAFVRGLPGVQSEELLQFPGRLRGMALNLDPDEIGVVLLDRSEDIEAGDNVYRTGRVLDTPVGEALRGRVVDAAGRPLDGAGTLDTEERAAIESEAPAIMNRSAVSTPLQTGIKAIDALVPIGRGQRELLLGDRQTGKTAIAVDTIINQRNYDVRCVYCAIGQQSAAVARTIDALRSEGALDYTTVVASTGEDTAGLRFAAPYAATSIAEWHMRRGEDVLVVYDDLTRHARAYRELSLLLRRPPGREAYPGDIFYIHSRMLERATQLSGEHGGGSLTALPIIETQAGNISAYIPTNLISITDGQIYLAPRLFQQGILPAIDVGKSVSRVGGAAQLRAYREVAGDLKLSYAQFEELERFSRYGTRLEESKRRQLERGRLVREALKQPPYVPQPPGEQVAQLLAVTSGVLDGLEAAQAQRALEAIRADVREQAREELERIESGEQLRDAGRDRLLELAKSARGGAETG